MIVKPREGLQLWPPTYIAFMDVSTGRFDRLKAVTSRDFGQVHAMDRPIGTYLTRAERLSDSCLTKEARLLQAFDVFLPSFAQRAGAPPLEVRQAATEFRTLFQEVAEIPLLAYYQFLAKEFFSWLTLVAP